MSGKQKTTGRKLVCIQRYSQHKPERYMKFIASSPSKQDEKHEVYSIVQDELFPSDANVIVLLKDKISSGESVASLKHIMNIISRAGADAKNNRVKKENTANRKKGQLQYVVRRLCEMLSVVFNLPNTIIVLITKKIKRRRP